MRLPYRVLILLEKEVDASNSKLQLLEFWNHPKISPRVLSCPLSFLGAKVCLMLKTVLGTLRGHLGTQPFLPWHQPGHFPPCRSSFSHQASGSSSGTLSSQCSMDSGHLSISRCLILTWMNPNLGGCGRFVPDCYCRVFKVLEERMSFYKSYELRSPVRWLCGSHCHLANEEIEVQVTWTAHWW